MRCEICGRCLDGESEPEMDGHVRLELSGGETDQNGSSNFWSCHELVKARDGRLYPQILPGD